MRKATAALVVLFLAFGFAAAALAESHAEKEPAKATHVCMHCKVGAEKAGKCPICDAEMKTAGTYMCPHCDTTAEKAGKCPCGQEYVKTEMAGKKCGGCGYIIAKDATGCPVCKKMHEEKKGG